MACFEVAVGGEGWDCGRRGEPTIGQQLIDLDRARDEGIITDIEYERTKEEILDSAR